MLALDEAKKGLGRTSPNPPVGCVIFSSSGEVLAKGFHEKCGGAHAEIHALNKIQDKSLLEGATVFVTLEPCAHEGRTGSCAKVLAEFPLARVIYGMQDPNPKVSGQGAEILKNSNIEVQCLENDTEFQSLQLPLKKLVEIFVHNMKLSSAFFALKVATSLDGQMALVSGESQWITSESSRERAQYMRGLYDAVMIGIGTFMSDDPKLNNRHPVFLNKTNKVVLYDPDFACEEKLETSNLLKFRRPEDIFVVVRTKTKPKVGVRLIQEGSFEELGVQLFAEGIGSVFIEGGAGLFSQFLKGKNFQRLYNFISPTLIGAGNGLCWTKGLQIEELAQKIRFNDLEFEIIENEIFVTGRLS